MGSIGHEHVVAERALVRGADGLNGGLGALIVGVGLECDADEVESHKSVSELKKFRFSIDAGAATGSIEPSVADFYGAVVKIEIQEARATDELIFGVGFCRVGFFDGYPDKAFAGRDCGKSIVRPDAKVSRSFHFMQHVLPDDRVEGDGFERREVLNR